MLSKRAAAASLRRRDYLGAQLEVQVVLAPACCFSTTIRPALAAAGNPHATRTIYI